MPDSPITSWMLAALDRGAAGRLSAEDRLLLAERLLRIPPGAPAPADTEPALARQQLRLRILAQLADGGAVLCDRGEAETGINCAEQAQACRGLSGELRQAAATVTEARQRDLPVTAGASVDGLQRGLDVLHAAEVDADLAARTTITDPRLPEWLVDYDARTGQVTATPAEAGSCGPDQLAGFAPTPAAALDLVADWTTPRSPVRLTRAAPARPKLRSPYEQHDPPPRLSEPAPLALLDRGGDCAEQFLVAAETVRAELRAEADVPGWLRRRAVELNRTSPHVTGSLSWSPPAAHRRPLGFLQRVPVWIDPRLIISTYSARWGEFGGHREDSLLDIVAGLADAPDAETWARELLDDDPISLLRTSGPAGPVYGLGSDGCHRIHAARLLGLPWLAARVSTTQTPVEIPVMELFTGQLHHLQDAGIRGRLDLLAGLHRRGVITAELHAAPDDYDAGIPVFGTLCCARLPAPWLLYPPARTTEINAAYERAYPGALADLGIPTDVGTDPDKWSAWCTTAG